MLEITGQDIAALNDEDLRSLVGRLCEAELRAAGLTTSSVTWGGNQNAPDGGIDVRVALSAEIQAVKFLPRADIGFQVKKTDFYAWPDCSRDSQHLGSRMTMEVS
jgi:hypothetical protein